MILKLKVFDSYTSAIVSIILMVLFTVILIIISKGAYVFSYSIPQYSDAILISFG